MGLAEQADDFVGYGLCRIPCEARVLFKIEVIGNSVRMEQNYILPSDVQLFLARRAHDVSERAIAGYKADRIGANHQDNGIADTGIPQPAGRLVNPCKPGGCTTCAAQMLVKVHECLAKIGAVRSVKEIADRNSHFVGFLPVAKHVNDCEKQPIVFFNDDCRITG